MKKVQHCSHKQNVNPRTDQASKTSPPRSDSHPDPSTLNLQRWKNCLQGELVGGPVVLKTKCAKQEVELFKAEGKKVSVS